MWDVASGKDVLRLRHGHSNTIWEVAFSPDGKRLATASADRTVKIWDTTTGQELLTLKGFMWGARSVAFSPDGNRLAAASFEEVVKVWDAAPLPEGP